MSISVVIPAYQAERYLAHTVQSIISQTVIDWELIIVDDGSTDSTPLMADRLAASDSRIRVVHQPNQGLAASRNAGLAASDRTRPYVHFIDADDLLEPDGLETLRRLFDQHPQALAAHGGVRFISDDGAAMPPTGFRYHGPRTALRDRRLVPVPDDQPTTPDMLIAENCVGSAGAVMIRKAALAALGPFDQSIAAVADWDMWFRLACHAPLAATPHPVLAYRLHSAAMSKNRKLMRQASLKMRSLWLNRSDPQRRRLIRRVYRALMRRVAADQLRSWARLLRLGKLGQATRTLPLTSYCLLKALPGVADVVLFASSRPAR
jgi:glycosyltransferase involved in cell wall biosynthesis